MKTAIIGVGEYGTTFINYAKKQEGEFFAVSVDTDPFTLNDSDADEKVYVLEGLSSKLDVIDNITKECGIVYIIGGIGGEVGGEYVYELAKYFYRKGTSVIGFIAKPFSFEGESKMQIANVIEERLKEFTSVTAVVDNHLLKEHLLKQDQMVTLEHAFEIIDHYFVSLIHQTKEGDFHIPQDVAKKLDTFVTVHVAEPAEN